MDAVAHDETVSPQVNPHLAAPVIVSVED